MCVSAGFFSSSACPLLFIGMQCMIVNEPYQIKSVVYARSFPLLIIIYFFFRSIFALLFDSSIIPCTNNNYRLSNRLDVFASKQIQCAQEGKEALCIPFRIPQTNFYTEMLENQEEKKNTQAMVFERDQTLDFFLVKSI